MRGYTIDKSIELLEKDVKMLKQSGAGGTSAELVTYNNQDTSLRSMTVQGALTELDDNVSSNVGMIEQLQLDVVNAELVIEELRQSLAQLVADLTPQNLSLTTESNVKQTYRLRAKKIGKEIVLNIYGALNAITSDLTSWKPLFQMPQGMGTSNHIDFTLCLGGAPYMVQAMVTNTGTIQFVPKQALNEGTLFFINLVYVLD